MYTYQLAIIRSTNSLITELLSGQIAVDLSIFSMTYFLLYLFPNLYVL